MRAAWRVAARGLSVNRAGVVEEVPPPAFATITPPTPSRVISARKSCPRPRPAPYGSRESWLKFLGVSCLALQLVGIVTTHTIQQNKTTCLSHGRRPLLIDRTMRTNHGGGYQWRIAPAKGALTEAVFQKTVLPFEGMSSLRWGGKAGKQLFFNATRISYGTVPTNSTVRLLLICHVITPVPVGPC